MLISTDYVQPAEEAYTDFLRTKNLIVCSYSRLDQFREAQFHLQSLNEYTIVANVALKHNDLYIYDNEGVCKTFQVDDRT